VTIHRIDAAVSDLWHMRALMIDVPVTLNLCMRHITREGTVPAGSYDRNVLCICLGLRLELQDGAVTLQNKVEQTHVAVQTKKRQENKRGRGHVVGRSFLSTTNESS
jgi:hypothetical protein